MFGKKVKKYRLDNKISIRKFADKLNMSTSNLYKIERMSEPTPKLAVMTVKKLAQELNISIDELVN